MIHEQFFIREWSKIFITKRDYLQRYRSQTKIMPNFSLTGSRTMFEEWEWNYLSKNRNNNTDIFLVCGFVRNSCTERSNRYFDRWNEKKSFPRVFLDPRNRGWKTDRGDGSWPKKGRKKRKGEKIRRRHLFPRQSFVLEEWLSLCKPPNTSTFSIVPPSSVTRGFLFRGQAFSREIAPL